MVTLLSLVFKTIKVICSLTLLVCLCFTIVLASSKQKGVLLKPDKATLDQSNAIKSKPLKGKAGSQALIGGISLSRTLPPLPKNLRKGAIFKEANIPQKIAKSTEWYRIPFWLAGKWHREKSTNINADGTTNTYTDRIDHVWGHQADRFGIVWQHRNEPYTEWIEHDDCNYSKTITLQKPVLVSKSKVIILYKDLTVQYSKDTHKIINTYQHEQLSEISRQGEELYEEIWGRIFDESGKCTQSDHGRATYQRINSFQPTDVDKKTGFNLKKDFALYLRTPKVNINHVR